MSFTWAAVISRDIALRRQAGAKFEFIEMNPAVLREMKEAEPTVYALTLDVAGRWYFDDLPIVENYRIEAYKLR